MNKYTHVTYVYMCIYKKGTDMEKARERERESERERASLECAGLGQRGIVVGRYSRPELVATVEPDLEVRKGVLSLGMKLFRI